ncbi:hypothetical protein GW17_00001064 [Ensete ventricosum]|nr:hypothetical protein GW17_00001064 [Ensete ventricosum]
MGACVSVQGDPDSAARWRLGMASKAKRFFVPSPAKEKAVNGENPVARFDLESQDFDAAEESVDIDAKLDEYKTKTDQPVNSSSATPFQSGASSICSSEVRSRRDLKGHKEKTWKTSHCCLPSRQRFGFDDRRQKMSPGPCTA